MSQFDRYVYICSYSYSYTVYTVLFSEIKRVQDYAGMVLCYIPWLSYALFSSLVPHYQYTDQPNVSLSLSADITLDPYTAHPRLNISVDGKEVYCGDHHQPVPDNPERFDRVVCVLAHQGFNSGRHYWEVSVTKAYHHSYYS